MVAQLGRALAVLAVLATSARAQPGGATSDVLREGNTAALAGDWPHVATLVDPLLQRSLAPADRAEAHRLAGIAAFFQQRTDEAERHVFAYLWIDLDGRLDPALYPPDVVAFFNDVASRHAAELRARRNAPRPSWVLALIPPIAQYQNGDHAKAYVLGGALVATLAVNLTTYMYIRAWCDHTDGTVGGGLTCDDGGDHTKAAARLRPFNIASGIAVIVLYGYGVYDGITGYRRRSREQDLEPMVVGSRNGVVVGISGGF